MIVRVSGRVFLFDDDQMNRVQEERSDLSMDNPLLRGYVSE